MRKQEFLSSGTWTAPAGLKNGECWVTACGGGGGGGGTRLMNNPIPGSAGGGGGGDSVYRKQLTVTASTAYTITIGSGGSAGISSVTAGSVTSGGDGGTTSFGALLSLTGGKGGGGTTTELGGRGGGRGGPGGTQGQTGGYHVSQYDDATEIAYGGISYPPGYGCGGAGAYYGSGISARDALAGNQGYMLIEWNE